MITQFIGYYTINGPTGYIQGLTRESVVEYLKAFLEKWPKATAGKVRRKLLLGKSYYANIWIKT